MRITDIRVDIIGDGADINPDKGGVEPLAIVRIDSDAGLTGLAECFRVPPGVAKAVMHGEASFFGTSLIGRELTHPSSLWQHLYDAMTHYNRRGWSLMCLGAIDIALWDLYGKYQGRPVHELLGSTERSYYQRAESNPEVEVVPYCTVVSDQWDNPAMLESQVDRALQLKAAGYRAFKVEPLMSTPENIVALARKAREALGPDTPLAVDVGYFFNDVPSALRVIRALEELDILFFETPFPVDDTEPYASLAEKTSLPIAMGEHMVGVSECRDMLERGKVSVIQAYMNTCGGLTEALRMLELVQRHGAQFVPGNWSTQILGCATVHFATHSRVTPFIEYAPAEVYDSPLRSEIQNLGFTMRGGAFEAPTTPGIGITLPEDLIRSYSLED